MLFIPRHHPPPQTRKAHEKSADTVAAGTDCVTSKYFLPWYILRAAPIAYRSLPEKKLLNHKARLIRRSVERWAFPMDLS